jgi:ribosomal protein S18 acetylase RimI-like enzyme
MNVEILHDKKRIERVLSKNRPLHIYEIGDLDDFFWDKTIWFIAGVGEAYDEIVLLYCGANPPVLIALYDSEIRAMDELLRSMRPYLPPRFHAHLSEGLIEAFGQEVIEKFYGKFYKMELNKGKVGTPQSDSSIRELCEKDVGEALELYKESYEDNCFNPRMLETGKFLGYFVDRTLRGIAGIHVYSEKYGVAALGNITIHPRMRNKGIGEKLTTALCNDLLKTVDTIGLNVAQNNGPALRCYGKVGFEVVGEYEEYVIRNLI